jgi:hypothetical protein
MNNDTVFEDLQEQSDPILQEALKHEQEKKMAKENLERLLSEIKTFADEKCSKCFGRGYRGIAYRGIHGQPIICNCAIKKKKAIDLEERKKNSALAQAKIDEAEEKKNTDIHMTVAEVPALEYDGERI